MIYQFLTLCRGRTLYPQVVIPMLPGKSLLLALELLGCSSWLLGQEGEVPGCSDIGTDFLLASGSDGTVDAAAVEKTTSGTAAGADTDAGAGDLA
jgi:hypothetical protein